MRPRALLAALALALPGPARANLNQATIGTIGTTGADFLQLGVGARALALGSAYTAVADDANAVYWNPAGLANIPESFFSATAMHAPYVASSYYDYLAVAQNMGSWGAFGASAQYFTLGGVNQTSVDGTSLGTINPYDLAASISYAHEFGGFFLGVTGKYISSKIATTATSEAADVGIMSPTFFDDRLRFGLVVQNIGKKIEFDQVPESLPLTYKAGGAWHFNEDWLVSLDADFPNDDSPYGAIGVERLWRFTPTLTFAGRAGFNSQTLVGLDGVTGLSVGVGFAGRDASIDYAFVPMGSLGMTHRFSLTWKFDTRRLRRAPPAAAAPAKPQEASSTQASVQYSTITSLPPPSHLHCEEYHGVTVCMDADQRQKINISYEPGDQRPPQGNAPEPANAAPSAPEPAPAPEAAPEPAPEAAPEPAPAPAPRTREAAPPPPPPSLPAIPLDTGPSPMDAPHDASPSQ